MPLREITEELAATGRISRPQLLRLLHEYTDEDREFLAGRARAVRAAWYGQDVYKREQDEINK